MTTALGLAGLLVLLVVGEIVLHAAHGVPPGTWGGFGALGCAALVVVSKALSRAGLQRPERPDE